MTMMNAYNDKVAARTRAAEMVLGTPDLLTRYEAQGGLKEDLQSIRDSGKRAEALNMARATNTRLSVEATAVVMEKFQNLRVDYSQIMAVLQAVRGDLLVAKAPPAQVAGVDKILANEAALAVETVEKDGVKQRKVGRSLSYESIRSEIQRDAKAMLDATELHPMLTRRKVTVPRLQALAKAAEDLSGKLGEQSLKRGSTQEATKAIHEAVAAQKLRWGSSYRVLRAVGAASPNFAELLKAGAR
jgi:hypothetical protein